MSKNTSLGKIIKGKPVADKISQELIQKVDKLKKQGANPTLAIVRVGQKSGDISYEKGALKRCEKIGIKVKVITLENNVSLDNYIRVIYKLNEDKTINGILCFRPLPKHLDENIIKYSVSPQKDVDCFNPSNLAKIVEGDTSGFPPCTPMAVVEMLKFYGVQIEGRNVVVIGRSLVVGKPVSMLLLNEHATVTLSHSRSNNLDLICREADILVTSAGRIKLIDDSYVKEGAVVIDVGINLDESGNLCGDVDLDKVLKKASMVTPVPAGVGSVTTSILVKHVLKAFELQTTK